MVHDDLLAPDVRDNPHTYFHALRAEDPVHWNANHRAWILTSYDDVLAGFRDARLSADRLNPQLPPVVANNLNRWMVFLDEPDHTRLRRLVGTAFSTLSVRSLRPRVESIVDSLLDDIEGRVDWVSSVAEPLPAIVIAELLGVPPSDRARFLSWSADIAHVVFGAVYRQDRYERAAAGIGEFDAYFRHMIEGDGGSGLVRSLASALDGDERLTTDEVIATCTLLLFAGHETTTSLLTTGLLALLEWPDEMERLRNEPSLAGDAIEELMRYTGPTGMMVRKAREEVEMRGKTMRAGERIFLGVAAANHDPDRFADPDRLDMTRADKSHLGFGFGIHHCLGAPLARLETEVTLTRLLERCREIRLGEQPTWSSSVMGRSLQRLMVDVLRR